MAIIDAIIKKFQCDICGYEWIPRRQRGVAPVPLKCASQACQRPDWNRSETGIIMYEQMSKAG